MVRTSLCILNILLKQILKCISVISPLYVKYICDMKIHSRRDSVTYPRRHFFSDCSGMLHSVSYDPLVSVLFCRPDEAVVDGDLLLVNTAVFYSMPDLDPLDQLYKHGGCQYIQVEIFVQHRFQLVDVFFIVFRTVQPCSDHRKPCVQLLLFVSILIQQKLEILRFDQVVRVVLVKPFNDLCEPSRLLIFVRSDASLSFFAPFNRCFSSCFNSSPLSICPASLLIRASTSAYSSS